MTRAAEIIRKYHVTLITFAVATLAIAALIYGGVGAIPAALAGFLSGCIVSWLLWAEEELARLEAADTPLARGRSPLPPAEYAGWIYGDPEDRETLKLLGVKGEMIWRRRDNSGSITPGAEQKSGVFEYCTITMEVARRLRDNYPAFPPQTFTGLDENEEQTQYQPLWKGVYE